MNRPPRVPLPRHQLALLLPLVPSTLSPALTRLDVIAALADLLVEALGEPPRLLDPVEGGDDES